MHRPIFLAAPLLSATLILAACGGGGTTGSGGSGGGATTGTGGSGGATTGTGGSGGGATTGTGGSGGATTGTGGSGGSGQVGLVPTVKSMDFFINCMPIVPADSVHGSFDATYDNTTGATPASATIKTARLLFNGSAADTWTFTVTPDQSGPVAAGMSATASHTKDAASGSGPKPPCGFCNGSW